MAVLLEQGLERIQVEEEEGMEAEDGYIKENQDDAEI